MRKVIRSIQTEIFTRPKPARTALRHDALSQTVGEYTKLAARRNIQTKPGIDASTQVSEMELVDFEEVVALARETVGFVAVEYSIEPANHALDTKPAAKSECCYIDPVEEDEVLNSVECHEAIAPVTKIDSIPVGEPNELLDSILPGSLENETHEYRHTMHDPRIESLLKDAYKVANVMKRILVVQNKS